MPTQDGVRLLVVFAFLQTMHYFVWVVFFPRYAPEAARAFEARAPWLTGARAWALGIGVGAALAVVFATDYASGKAVYSAFASYHAYLEFPVVLAMLLGLGAVTTANRRNNAVSTGQVHCTTSRRPGIAPWR